LLAQQVNNIRRVEKPSGFHVFGQWLNGVVTRYARRLQLARCPFEIAGNQFQSHLRLADLGNRVDPQPIGAEPEGDILSSGNLFAAQRLPIEGHDGLVLVRRHLHGNVYASGNGVHL
jgi:hypothetical protein